MIIISYIAALWCAGYCVFVMMQMRYNGLGFWAALVDTALCGILAPVAGYTMYKFMYALINCLDIAIY